MTATTPQATPPETAQAPAASRPPGRRRQLAPYAFIAPFYVLYGLFMIVPILVGVYLSLTEWVGLGTPEYVGLRNFSHLAQDTSFHKALSNSLIFVLVSVFLVVPAALLIAQALNVRGLRARDLFRVTFFVPMVLSPIVISLVYSLLLDREYGVVNSVLRALFGTGNVDWLGDPTMAKVSVSFVLMWRWVGYLTIFFLAALQAVPRELYESADIDGAGMWRKFTTVTLPSIQPVTAFVVVTSFIGSAQLFDEPYLVTGGGPGEETLTVAMFVYRAAFERQQFGYAAAAGLVLFVIVFGISQVLNRLLSIGRIS
ncbi:sugar ABC transporter permease [Streptomyces sp. B6B3]|jgi:multiple sugar transport system permease protein|uniref:carbohydrate ABC transporter permease n=1 Tax=Streptomyces sp. B6B3 TaxID=3153570 RepID=UPI00325D0D4E